MDKAARAGLASSTHQTDMLMLSYIRSTLYTLLLLWPAHFVSSSALAFRLIFGCPADYRATLLLDFAWLNAFK